MIVKSTDNRLLLFLCFYFYYILFSDATTVVVDHLDGNDRSQNLLTHLPVYLCVHSARGYFVAFTHVTHRYVFILHSIAITGVRRNRNHRN